jgi:hypothetical protein
MEWQPIETAPQDGTLIIVFRPKGGGKNKIPRVSEDYWMTTYDGERCWARSNDSVQPKLWMPMPVEPTTRQSER